MGKERCQWLDTLRGIAIILVIVGHVIGGLENIGGGSNNVVREVIYTFHMPLMFIISGYVAKEYNPKDRDKIEFLINFIKKSIISLYIPYLIFGYLFWAVKFFIYAGNGTVTLADGLNLWWNYGAWIPGWYLLTLLTVRIVDILIQEIKRQFEIIGVIWLVIYFLGSVINVYLISKICEFGIYYFIGRSLKKIKKEEISYKQLAISFVGLLIGSFVYINISKYIGKLAIGSSVSVILFVVFSKYNIANSLIALLGKNSMIPYTLHAYLTIPLRVILDKIGFQSLVIYTVTETIAAILLSLITIVLIQKVKIFNWVIYLFYPARKGVGIKKSNSSS